jgi:hypothetical protein
MRDAEKPLPDRESPAGASFCPAFFRCSSEHELRSKLHDTRRVSHGDLAELEGCSGR